MKAYTEIIEAARVLYEHPHTNDALKVVLEKTYPEIADSEDERIRKAAVWYLEHATERCAANYHGITPKEIIAWLEKQKEQIPYIDFVIKPHKGDDNNPYDMRVSEAQEYAIKRGFGIPFNDGEVYVDERHLTQTIGNILRWADEHPKEQKPVARENDFVSKPIEWSDNFEENVRNLLHDKITWHSEDGSISSTVFIDDKTLKDIICGIWFYVGKEALKYPNKELNVTEWSEEDKDYYDAIIAKIEVTQDDAMLTDNQIDFLKSLPERFIIQPKQEWSDEDETNWQNYIKQLELQYSKRPNVVLWDDINWLKSVHDKFKSLRPQPHTVSIKDATKFGNLEYERGVKDGIQSEKSRHWKPSEEQIEALRVYLYHPQYINNSEDIRIKLVESLYNDLKKL